MILLLLFVSLEKKRARERESERERVEREKRSTKMKSVPYSPVWSPMPPIVNEAASVRCSRTGCCCFFGKEKKEGLSERRRERERKN